MTIARHVSAGSARDRDSARPARHSANVCVGADVSSAQAERKLGSTLTAAQEEVTTREGLDCVGLDWEGLDFNRAVPVLSPLVIPSGFAEARRVEPRAKPRGRNLLFPVPAIHESSGNSEIRTPPQPLQGRDNDSPARKCRVSVGSRSRTLRAPPPTPHRTAKLSSMNPKPGRAIRSRIIVFLPSENARRRLSMPRLAHRRYLQTRSILPNGQSL